MEIEDCFLDGHGNYTSNLVSFKTNILRTKPFPNSEESIGSAKWCCHHTYQEPKWDKERNNQKNNTKRGTNTCNTLGKKIFLPQAIVIFQQVVPWYW